MIGEEDDVLLSRIDELREQLGPGKRLPSERALSERWNVSRVTLRDRIRAFESIGLLERRGTAGVYTREVQPEDLASILSIGFRATILANPHVFRSVRIALEMKAAVLALSLQAPVPLAYAEQATRVMETSTDPEELLQADRDFHHAILEASGDPGLKFVAKTFEKLTERSMTMVGGGDARAQIRDRYVRAHRQMLEAIRSGEAAQVLDAVSRHYSEVHPDLA
ncbi:FadR/GntR family transcriptional regulator [Microbacterium suwonense]|uniref:Transcriptional regulator n=1 Tax=Microbacterium suwonense TaxID=683047 RepID=A0ABM8FR59_9MICO|nr:FCD domain-containing protein [Microbacterium suwonense]BDZ38162.1 transcriptional regulator [Microbacterium suwonense]